jgi:MerR family transcriptional regulator, heat shock protein HspR
MISAVAEMYNIHPQTLRLYEREGLLLPSRSDGNTRLYTDEDLERLEVILNLTRDLGVNLAGIEIILNMRARMKEMEREVQALVEFTRGALATPPAHSSGQPETGLVRIGRRHIIRTRSVRAS